jgi:protein gp37
MGKARAAVRWLSCEPLIEPLRFERLDLFQWVVIGGASSSKATGGTPATREARPHVSWLGELMAQASDVGARVFVKENARPVFYPGARTGADPETLRYLPARPA